MFIYQKKFYQKFIQNYRSSFILSLVEHNSDLASSSGSWQVAVKLAPNVTALAVGPHDLTPDNSGPGFLTVYDFGVFGGFVDVGYAFSHVPVAGFEVVDAFELDNSLLAVLLFETATKVGEDTTDVKPAFGHDLRSEKILKF